MISLILPFLLQQVQRPAPVDVVVARRLEMPPARAAKLASGLGRALTRAGMENVRDPDQSRPALTQEATERCRNDRRCLSELARTAGSRLLVALDAGLVLDQTSFTLFALTPRDESQVLRETFTVSVSEGDSAIQQRFGVFASRLARAVPNRTEAPEAATAHVLEEPETEHRGWLAPTAVSLAAAGGTASTAWFLYSGNQAEQALRAAEFQSTLGPASSLSHPQAEALVQQANQDRAVAAATGAATTLLISWAVWLWTSD